MRIFIKFIFFLFLCSNIFSQGIDYSNIRPGISYKRDVVSVLGEPIEEIIPLARYRYASEHYAIKYIDVVYDRLSSRVNFFTLYFEGNIYRDEALTLFNLFFSDKTLYGLDGNLIEVYLPECILIHYSSTGNNSAVSSVDILDSRLIENYYVENSENLSEVYIYGLGVFVENIPKHGVVISKIVKDSPAEIAGLIVGDIIMEIEDFIFADEENKNRFKRTISLMPIEQELSFLVRRTDSDQFIDVRLRSLTPKEREMLLREEANLRRHDERRQLLPVRGYGSETIIEADKESTEFFLPFGVDFDKVCDYDRFDQIMFSGSSSEGLIYRVLPGILVEDDEYNMPGEAKFDFSYLAKEDVTFLMTSAVTFMKSGHYLEASEDLIAILNKSSSDKWANYALAFCYDKLNKNTDAIFYYNKSLSYWADNKNVVKHINNRLDKISYPGLK